MISPPMTPTILNRVGDKLKKSLHLILEPQQIVLILEKLPAYVRDDLAQTGGDGESLDILLAQFSKAVAKMEYPASHSTPDYKALFQETFFKGLPAFLSLTADSLPFPSCSTQPATVSAESGPDNLESQPPQAAFYNMNAYQTCYQVAVTYNNGKGEQKKQFSFPTLKEAVACLDHPHSFPELTYEPKPYRHICSRIREKRFYKVKAFLKEETAPKDYFFIFLSMVQQP